jgi:aldose 1-epimerase
MKMGSPEDRSQALLASPAGCVLLLIAEEHHLTPQALAKPEIGLFAIADAIGQVSPWNDYGHDRIVKEAFRHAPRLGHRALELTSYPGIAWWWAPIDRDNQLWLPQHDSFICPEEVWDLRPRSLPNPHERYAHSPLPRVTTSELRNGLSSELAGVLTGNGDWDLDFPINARKTTIRPTARVLEINTAQDWHDLVHRYPADGAHGTMPDYPNEAWGAGEGLMVPDWRSASRDWDGVHITPWALLTATQVRITSDIGWTEPWAWEGAHTLWLNWEFASIADLPPIEADTYDVPHYGTEALNFTDPNIWKVAVHPPQGGWLVERGVTREPFGEVDGQAIEKYTLTNGTGMSVSILTYGGIIQSLSVPDRHGKVGNVVLGFDNLDDYVEKSPYFGAIVGRFANRIAHGRFELDGNGYILAQNNGPNALHGGTRGFDRQVWTAEVDPYPEALGLILKRTSPDGEEGYPGSVDVTVSYQLAEGNALHIFYMATTDAPTVLNLSNHSYFNLAGEGSGTILRHVLQLRASHYTPVNESLIPTGEIVPVAGTPFDFTEAHIIGERIDQAGNEQLAFAGGYDHNFVLDRPEDLPFHPSYNIRVIDPTTGRVMDATTDQPGVQFYTGNFLDGSFSGTSGQVYDRRAGFCLETQHFPDSPNQPQFPSTVLLPGERGFHSTTTFSFGVL